MKICQRGTWNTRMLLETVLSMLWTHGAGPTNRIVEANAANPITK